MSERAIRPTYTDEQRHMAMIIWGFRANRNSSETARMLSTDEFREIGLDGVPRQTIAEWAREHRWNAAVNKELYRDAPTHRWKAQAELVLAAPEAARILREIITNATWMYVETVVRDTNGIPVVDESGQHAMTELVFNEKLVKLRLEAAKLVLDRTGFSPVGTRDVGTMDSPPEDSAGVLVREDIDWADAVAVQREHDRVYKGVGIGG